LNIVQNAKLYIKWIAESVRLDALSAIAKNRKVFRGQVYWCYFGINIGSEQNEKRPCLIIQNNMGNLSAATTIVAPITHTKRDLPSVVPISDKYDNAGKLILDGNVLLGHIRAICKSRLSDYITNLTADEMKWVDEAVAKTVDIHTTFIKQEKQLARQQRHINNLTETICNKDFEIAGLKDEINKLKNN